jgi:transcriptional regulator with XRE-family HTH domain
MKDFGEYLKREREARNISLEEISSATKIQIKFLKALEEGNFEVIPGIFFIRSFLKAYSNYIGLDEREVINRFYQEVKPKESFQKTYIAPTKEKRVIPWNKIGLIIFVVLIIYFSLSLIFKSKKESVIYETEIIPRYFTSAIIPYHVPKILLELNFKEKTWIQIYSDGKLEIDGIIEKGEKRKIEAEKEILINTGNAGGVIYFLNGRKGKKLGESGRVIKNIRITLDNWRRFIENKY